MRALLCAMCALMLVAAPAGAVTADQQKKIEQLTKSAVESFNAGNYSQAMSLLKEVLSINPMDKTAARYLMITEQQVIEPYCREAAEAYMDQDYQSALEHWERILKIKPEDPRVEGLIEMTRSVVWTGTLNALHASVSRALKEGNYEMAVIQLQKILSLNPNDRHAQDLLGSTKLTLRNMQVKKLYETADEHMKKGEYDEAIEQWRKVLQLDENQEAASRLIATAVRSKLKDRYAEAEKLFRTGDYIGSRDLYYLLMSDNPTDQDVKVLVSRLNDVLTIAQKIKEKGQVWDMLRESLANHIAIDGNVKAAIAGAWYAGQLEPDNRVAISVRDFLESKHVSAVRTMEPPARNMNIIDQYLFASLNHIYEGRYDLAVEMCGIVLELQPDNVLAWKRLGSAYLALGKKEKAREAWQKALVIAPNDAELKKFISQTK